MLMAQLEHLRKEMPSLLEAKTNVAAIERDVPQLLSSMAKKVTKAEALAAKQARFAKIASKSRPYGTSTFQNEGPEEQQSKSVCAKKKCVRVRTGFSRCMNRK